MPMMARGHSERKEKEIRLFSSKQLMLSSRLQYHHQISYIITSNPKYRSAQQHLLKD